MHIFDTQKHARTHTFFTVLHRAHETVSVGIIASWSSSRGFFAAVGNTCVIRFIYNCCSLREGERACAAVGNTCGFCFVYNCKQKERIAVAAVQLAWTQCCSWQHMCFVYLQLNFAQREREREWVRAGGVREREFTCFVVGFICTLLLTCDAAADASAWVASRLCRAPAYASLCAHQPIDRTDANDSQKETENSLARQEQDKSPPLTRWHCRCCCRCRGASLPTFGCCCCDFVCCLQCCQLLFAGVVAPVSAWLYSS